MRVSSPRAKSKVLLDQQSIMTWKSKKGFRMSDTIAGLAKGDGRFTLAIHSEKRRS